jgi:putative membrane protein
MVTYAAITYPEPSFADDRIHGTMVGFISLLIVFRTSQAYARWWEARALWGSIVNSTRNLASNAACWMNDDARYQRVIICA